MFRFLIRLPIQKTEQTQILDRSVLTRYENKKSTTLQHDQHETSEDNKSLSTTLQTTAPIITDNNDDENIDHTSSSSPEEVTRENSLEKDDVDPSSPDDINEDKKDAEMDIENESNFKDDSKIFPSSTMEPPDASKLSVKDRMTIGRQGVMDKG